MNRFFLILVLVFVSCKKTINVSMMTSTSMQTGLPFTILEGKNWQPEEKAEFVKIHMYLDDAIQLSKIEIQSCDGDFVDTIHAFVNFDEFIRQMEKTGKSASAKFPSPISARSITFNFYKNNNLCISDISLFDEKDKKYKLKTPDLIEGTVKASETGTPESSYSVMNLFDSRYEYSYASKNNGKGVALDFQFEADQKIKAIKIWNGYQRSDIHCVENGRVKSFLVTGDDGYSEKISLKDEMGSQLIELPKIFKGKQLKLTVDEIYPGKKYPGIVISELRFFDGNNFSLINPFPYVKDVSKKNREEFAKVSLEEILNLSLRGFDNTNQEGITNSNWSIRLRTDGSMFLEGTINKANYESNESEVKTVYALGNYEVKSATNNLLSLRIFGLLRENKSSEQMEMGGDCNGCARDCNLIYKADPNKIEKIFAEFVDLEKIDGVYYLKNQKRSGNFDFTKAELTVE